MKKIKCSLTAKQIFYLLKATDNFKVKMRDKYLDKPGVVQYLHSKLDKNITTKEWTKFNKEWKEMLEEWKLVHNPPKKKKVKEKQEVVGFRDF